MSDNLNIEGSLSETTVPDLFRMLIRGNETAIVSLEQSQRQDHIYFRDGAIVFAWSTDPDLGLAEVLLTKGELSLAEYRAASESVSANRRIETVLSEMGYVGLEELPRAVELQIARIVEHAVAIRSGKYTIEFVSNFPEGGPTLAIETERLILDAMQKIDRWSLIERAVGSMNRILQQIDGADTKAYYLELSAEESHVLGLVAESQSIASACERSYLSNFAVCRLLWALQVLNLVEAAEAREVNEKRAAAENEYQLEAEVEKFNRAFQAIYAMVFQEIGDYAYDFVDRVIARMSARTMPYLSGMNLIVNESRIDFDQLLNNLVASGAEDHRQLVQEVLNELLYAWILEVRLEFEERLEEKLAVVLEQLKQ
jgi:hypothetical protein